MALDKHPTLLMLAKKSFAEIRAAFPGCSETEIAIDQDPPEEYRVQVTFVADPWLPTLRIARYPKPNLPPPLQPERAPRPQHLQRSFNALGEGSQFRGWSECSVSEAPHSSTDIIGIVRGLL